MEALKKMITEKTGISQSQATTAIQTVVTFLKDKMPAGMGSQVESFINNDGKGVHSDVTDNILEKAGGIFGNRK
jgi:hypothetical protein